MCWLYGDVFGSLGCIVGIRAWYCVATFIELPKCFRKWQHQGVCEMYQFFTCVSTLFIVCSAVASVLWGLLIFLCWLIMLNTFSNACLIKHFYIFIYKDVKFISLNKCLFKFSIFKIACLVFFFPSFYFVIKASLYLSPLFTHKTWKYLLRLCPVFSLPWGEGMPTNFPCEELHSIFPSWSSFGSCLQGIST